MSNLNFRIITNSFLDVRLSSLASWQQAGDKEQKRRFEARMEDPLRQWKLSPMDLPSRSKWFDYSRARALVHPAFGRQETRPAPATGAAARS